MGLALRDAALQGAYPITALAIALASVLWVEIVRDLYHTLSHLWQPLYRLHVWHHKVFRRDLSVVSDTIYRQAHWYNDVPESLVMLVFSILPWGIVHTWEIAPQWTAGAGSLYTLTFLFGAIARGMGMPMVDELTDLTHRPGEFTSLPSKWFVNRPYHWRHHFDNQDAYFSGTLTLIDKLLGTALSLKNKRIAVTGASGTLGRALLTQLHLAEAKVTALTSSPKEISLHLSGEELPITTISWEIGKEAELIAQLDKIDILIINHGINVYGERDGDAIAKSYEINTFSTLRLIEAFYKTIKSDRDKIRKEIWVNTSEAEVNPALSPLYELSKRATGDIVTMSRLDAPCVIRKLILGPFKSKLNPVGVMSADWVAKQIVNLAKRDVRNIIVTINPLTYILFPIKEFCVANYFRLFSNPTNKH
ncbi:bifunctional sterol desaturase/short chain dehydrogenase [Waterburya agarophytonicola K14]|uniref:Bifunctional sterol desaturase/short chain dehydrogenase n=1 Tax=Waterburya agarophytonicola KI4 TaxID=2874699 RepID=A0A964BPY9_9CYAN|nr:bifunctional sterol desaturase/short chain dehydrogenase [Waterburya agarophytonicola KI4]